MTTTLVAPIPTAGPTPGNLWFAQLLSAKHAASNDSVVRGLAAVLSVSTDSSTHSAPTAVTRLKTAQGLVKWPSSWQSTVLEQQAELEDDLAKGVLRNHAEESLAAIYQKAVKYAMRETKLPAPTFPKECPWTLDQLLSEDVLAE
jgi:hypothetical protein